MPRLALTGDSLGGKIFLAGLAAAFGALATLVTTRMTSREPRLMLGITAPRTVFGQNKVLQFITIRNTGEDVAKGVRLGLMGCEGRLYDDELAIQFTPPRPDAIKAVYGADGECVLTIGDLQPNAYSTIKLSYKNPAFGDKDIQTFSDNARVEATNIASPELLQ
jgi:hypothetical protein